MSVHVKSFVFTLLVCVSFGCSDEDPGPSAAQDAEVDSFSDHDLGMDATVPNDTSVPADTSTQSDVPICATGEIDTEDGCFQCSLIDVDCGVVVASDAEVDLSENRLTVPLQADQLRYSSAVASGSARKGGGVSAEVSPIAADGVFMDGAFSFDFDPMDADSIEIFRITFNGGCLETDQQLQLSVAWELDTEVSREPMCFDE